MSKDELVAALRVGLRNNSGSTPGRGGPALPITRRAGPTFGVPG